jgi:hypothetical protein
MTRSSTLTTTTYSKKVHTTCLAFMSLLKATQEVIPSIVCRIPISSLTSRHCPIGSVFRFRQVRRKKSKEMLRVVVVFCAGAHVVCICVYLNMSKWGRCLTEVWRMGTYSIWELGARQNECNEHTHDKGRTREIVCRQVCKCHTRRTKYKLLKS